MTNSHGNNSGCFSGILRRILCTGNVPTHPSDQILDSNKVVESKSNFPEKEAKVNEKVHQIQSPCGPGIVARLMGLDSLPETKWVPGDRTPDSVGRSRSVNFADYLLKFDPSSNNEAQHHRRVRTSVSFREVPSSLNEQNHDFLFVYLDNAHESKEIGLKGKKCEVGFGEKKQGMMKEESRNREKEKKRENERMKNNNNKKEKNQGTRKKISKLKDEPRRELVRKKNSKNCSTSGSGPKGLGSVLQKNVNINGGGNSKPENQKKVTKQKSNKKRKNQQAGKKIEPISQENSSGVSVINIYDLLIQNETKLSAEDSLQSLNLKKKSSAKVHNSEGLLEGSAVKKEDNEAIFSKWETEDYVELANQLNRLTDEDIKESNWMAKNMLEFEGFDEEICIEFERKIVDNLLHQLIEELVEIP